MDSGDHGFDGSAEGAERELAELDERNPRTLKAVDSDEYTPSEFTQSERTRYGHGMEWLPGWQYGQLWRFVPRPLDDDTRPAFEPFGPLPLPGGGWELNINAGEYGIETRSPAQPDVLMQITYWRRESPGLRTDNPKHKVSRRYE